MQWVDYLGRAVLVGDAYRVDGGLSVDALLPFDGEAYRRAAAPLLAEEERLQAVDDPAAEARLRAGLQAAMAGVLPAGRMDLRLENAPGDAGVCGRGGMFVPGLCGDGPAAPHRAKYGAAVPGAFFYQTITVRGPWPAARPLRLSLCQTDRWLPLLLPFTVDGQGAKVPFTHPATGVRHVLEARPLEVCGRAWGKPSPCSVYTVHPPLPDGQRLDICQNGARRLSGGAVGYVFSDQKTRMFGFLLAEGQEDPAQCPFFLAGVRLPDRPRAVCSVPAPADV